VGSWKPCEVSGCGDGIQKRDIYCMKDNNGLEEILSHENCNLTQDPKPNNMQNCRVECANGNGPGVDGSIK